MTVKGCSSIFVNHSKERFSSKKNNLKKIINYRIN